MFFEVYGIIFFTLSLHFSKALMLLFIVLNFLFKRPKKNVVKFGFVSFCFERVVFAKMLLGCLNAVRVGFVQSWYHAARRRARLVLCGGLGFAASLEAGKDVEA